MDSAIEILSWLSPLIHAQPYVWTLLSDFQPRLQWIAIPPPVEHIIALLWSFLDALYVPILISLDPIIEPYLKLEGQSRKRLHGVIYTWGWALVLYKLR